MPTPIYSETMGELVVRLARGRRDEVAEGTADSGTATTLVDAELVYDDDSIIKGAWIYFYAGTGSGRIAQSTFAGTTITLSPTGTAPTTSTKYLVCREFSPKDYIEALQRAQFLIGNPQQQYPNLLERVDRSQILGSPIENGNMYLWTAGINSAPDGFTLGGAGAAVAREGTITRSGFYSAKIDSASAVATLSQSLTRIGRFKGKSLIAKAWVFNNTASEMTLRLSDGTTNNDKANAGSSWWEKLETASLTPGNGTTQITVSIRLATGTKTGYVSSIWLPTSGLTEVTLDADNNFVAIDRIGLGSSVAGTTGQHDEFIRDIPLSSVGIVRETVRRLHLNIPGYDESPVSIEGWQPHAELTAATTAWTGNPEAILLVADAYLDYWGATGEDRARAYARVVNEAERSGRLFGVRLNGALKVEPN